MNNIFIIFVIILISSIKGDENPNLFDVWNCIKKYNQNTINKLNESTISLEQSKTRLIKSNTITLSSGVDPIEVDNGENANGKVNGRLAWSNQVCNIGVVVNSYDTKYENLQIDLGVPLYSSKKLKVNLIEESIALTNQISLLNIERLLHTSIKSVFSSKIQYDYICSEIKIRKKINNDGEKILSKLSAFIKQGLIANKSLNPIKLYLYDNKLAISSLIFDKKIILENIYQNHLIPEEIFTALNLETILNKINNDSTVFFYDYDNKSDSLTYLLNKLNEKQSNLNSWTLDLNSSSTFKRNAPDDISNVGLQLQYTLKSKQDKTYTTFTRSPKPRATTDLSTEIIKYGNNMEKYSITAEKWIDETFEKIKLGNINVMHEFTSNFGIILSCNQNYSNMKAKYNRRILSNFFVLEQLPKEMRPNL